MSAKDQFLQIRVTPEQKAAIKAHARLAGADMSSYVLERVLPAPRAEFEALVAELARSPHQRRPVLAALNDFLTRAGLRDFTAATAQAPAAKPGAYLANYVAAMVETAAHRLSVPAPEWTADVPPLDRPVFGSPLPGLRLHLLMNSPPAFRRRNIFIDSTVGSRV